MIVINVARFTGRQGWQGDPVYLHFFRVEIEACDRERAREVYDSLQANYPAPQYNVTSTKWECRGRATGWEA
jgi:hypothetical protein